MVSGVALVLGAGAVVAAAELAPMPSAAPAAARAVPLHAGDVVLACPGAPRLLAVDGVPAADPEFDARARTTASVTALAVGGPMPRLTLTTGDEQVSGAVSGWLASASSATAEQTVVRAVPPAGERTRAAALQTALTTDGDLRGLAASACAEPARHAWLAGGGTVVGRSARLELVNPGATTAVVDVTVLTPDGVVDAPAGQDVVVAGGESAELLVEGLAPGADALALGVSVAGGRVGAALVDSWLDGLTPQGTDVVVPGLPPAEQQVVPAAAVLTGGSAPLLRLAVPGHEDAVVRWQIHGEAGQVEAEGESATTVPAGSVVDVPLEGLEPGVYAVVVDADVPVVASVTSTSGAAGEASDRTSAASVDPLRDRTLVPLPPAGVSGRLVLAAGEDAAAVEVSGLHADGSVARSRSVTVPARSTAEVPLQDVAGRGTAVLAVQPESQGGELRAALLLTAEAADGDPLVATVPLRPAPADPGTLAVRPLPDGRWP